MKKRYVSRCCNFSREKFGQERSGEDSKTQRPYNRHAAYVECKNKSANSDNRGDCNHFRITQTVAEQHTEKARYQETTDNSHTVY